MYLAVKESAMHLRRLTAIGPDDWMRSASSSAPTTTVESDDSAGSSNRKMSQATRGADRAHELPTSLPDWDEVANTNGSLAA
jgi:hypothetical protein